MRASHPSSSINISTTVNWLKCQAPETIKPRVLAQEIRIRQAHFLKMAEQALNNARAPDWQREFEHDQAMRQAHDLEAQAKVYDDLERMMCSGYHTSGFATSRQGELHALLRSPGRVSGVKPERDWMRDEISDPHPAEHGKLWSRKLKKRFNTPTSLTPATSMIESNAARSAP